MELVLVPTDGSEPLRLAKAPLLSLIDCAKEGGYRTRILDVLRNALEIGS